MMTREFHITCDSCNRENDSEPYADDAVNSAKENGWHLRNYTAICDECWADGTRFKSMIESAA